VILLLLFLGFYPDLSTLGEYLLFTGQPNYLRDSYAMYHFRAEAGAYEQFRNVPIILIVYFLVYGLLSRELKEQSSQDKVQTAYRSIALGATLALLFASVSDVQVRFYEFFFVVGLVLAGTVRTSRGVALCYFLALCYFVKFNVTWSIWTTEDWWRAHL
jgi:hypothetical protein